MSQNDILYYIGIGILFALVFVVVLFVLPNKKYRSWSIMKRETEELKVKTEIEEERENNKDGGIMKYISPAQFERAADSIEWDVGTKAPLIIYGSILAGIALGVLMKSPIVALCAAIGGAWVPWFYLNNRIQKYEDIAEEQVEVLIQAVSSGYSITRNLTVAMERATNSLDEPLRTKWKAMMAEYVSGRSLSVLLEEMQQKIPVEEFKVFASVLQVVENSGGDASETMKQVATVIQSKRVLKEEGKAEMVQQRQAFRMNVMIGILIVLFFRFAQAEQYSEFIQQPIGQLLLTIIFGYILWAFQKVNKLTRI